MSHPNQRKEKNLHQHLLLLDDHEIGRFGVMQMIRQDWPSSKVYEAESYMEAGRLLHDHKVYVFIPDVKVPGLSLG
ncbi:MAG: hypothetical protein RL160_443 [Bacteroidota bacterium]|jgi:DNA-binding NarL/FixJ family response regulator